MDNQQTRPYIGFYKGKQATVNSTSKYQAQLELAKMLNARKSYDVVVELLDVPINTSSL